VEKEEAKKIPVKDQKPQNENVWKTQQAEKGIGSRIRKPFAQMSPKHWHRNLQNHGKRS